MIAIAMTANPRALDRYVLDTLMRDLVGHDRRPSAFLVYLAIEALARDGRRPLSHAELAEQTGLSKRAVQDGIKHLEGRGLIGSARRGATEAPVYRPLRPWRG